MDRPIFYKKKTFDYDFWIKWISTAMACACAFSSSMNWYPINVIFGCLGGAGWVYVGFKWKEPSIILINIMMTIIYGAGWYAS